MNPLHIYIKNKLLELGLLNHNLDKKSWKLYEYEFCTYMSSGSRAEKGVEDTIC